ncbi:MAG: hypothetical protein ABJM67_22195, partial [Rhodopirellula bahusiensis]
MWNTREIVGQVIQCGIRVALVGAFAVFLMVDSNPISAADAIEFDRDAKPNILFIFADDWGWGDLSCHRHPYVKTP